MARLDCEKIIIDGGLAAGIIYHNCELIERATDAGLITPDAEKALIEMTIDIEQRALEFHRRTLEVLGYKGPLPWFLKKRD